MGRPADDHERRRELSGLRRRDHGARDDARTSAGRPSASAPSSSPTTSRGSTSPAPASGVGRRRRVHARSVIVATGASAAGSGSSPSSGSRAAASRRARPATARSSRRRTIVVVGGGDSAFEEALFLTRFGHEVSPRAPPRRLPRLAIMVNRAARTRRSSSAQRRRRGGPRRRDRPGPEAAKHGHRRARELEAEGFFVAIGHDPNTKLFLDQLDHDENGYLVTQPGLDGDERPRRLRGRRRAGPHLPPGRHRRRLGLYGRPRRRALPRRAPRASGHGGNCATRGSGRGLGSGAWRSRALSGST